MFNLKKPQFRHKIDIDVYKNLNHALVDVQYLT